MKQLPINSLRPSERLDGTLCTLDGRPLVAALRPLTQVQIDAMREAGIEAVLKLALNETYDPTNHKRDAVAVQTLPVGHPVAENLYDDEDRLLIGAGQKVTPETLDILEQRHLRSVFAHHDQGARQYFSFIETSTQSLIGDLDRLVDSDPDSLRVTPVGVPAVRSIRIWHGNRRPRKITEQILRDYSALAASMTQCIWQLRKGQMLTRTTLDEVLDETIEILGEDKDLAMNLPNVALEEVDHVVKHSIDVALLAAATGIYLNYNATQVRELAEAALLHDIGMLEVPEITLSKSSPLTKGEKSRIYRHTNYGLRVLHRVQTDSLAVALVIHQSHERESGHGYPANRKGEQIHDYARIVAIADMYQALIQPRPHRQRLHPVSAMQSIVKMMKVGLLKKESLLAFGRAMGAYPIGSFLATSDGQTARVVASNDQDLYSPRISLLLDAEGKTASSSQFVQVRPEKAAKFKPCTDDMLLDGLSPFEGF